jgi:hypothetical protein
MNECLVLLSSLRFDMPLLATTLPVLYVSIWMSSRVLHSIASVPVNWSKSHANK